MDRARSSRERRSAWPIRSRARGVAGAGGRLGVRAGNGARRAVGGRGAGPIVTQSSAAAAVRRSGQTAAARRFAAGFAGRPRRPVRPTTPRQRSPRRPRMAVLTPSARATTPSPRTEAGSLGSKPGGSNGRRFDPTAAGRSRPRARRAVALATLLAAATGAPARLPFRLARRARPGQRGQGQARGRLLNQPVNGARGRAGLGGAAFVSGHLLPNGKMVFQSAFMSTTVQPLAFASSSALSR